MSNVEKQLMPSPVTHELGENGCCPNPRAWEMEMMHQVWAAGLHDAANCFQNALEAKWKLESQRKAKPKTKGDEIRAMSDKELAYTICDYASCLSCPAQEICAIGDTPAPLALENWLRSPANDGGNEENDKR